MAYDTRASRHHSAMFPCMSYSPKSFGSSSATAWSRPSELPRYHPTRARSSSVSPEWYRVVVPARHAYSHCASVGSVSPAHSQ